MPTDHPNLAAYEAAYATFRAADAKYSALRDDLNAADDDLNAAHMARGEAVDTVNVAVAALIEAR